MATGVDFQEHFLIFFGPCSPKNQQITKSFTNFAYMIHPKEITLLHAYINTINDNCSLFHPIFYKCQTTIKKKILPLIVVGNIK